MPFSARLMIWSALDNFPPQSTIKQYRKSGLLSQSLAWGRAGVAHQLALPARQSIAGLVNIDIEHTFIGDLVVSLEGPSGQVAVLHNRTGGSIDNLEATYATADTTSLAILTGTPTQGDWSLRISRLGRYRYGAAATLEFED